MYIYTYIYIYISLIKEQAQNLPRSLKTRIFMVLGCTLQGVSNVFRNKLAKESSAGN